MNIAVADAPSAAPVRTASMSSFEQVAPPSPTRSADGWGDAEDSSVPDLGDEDGGWDDVDPFEEPKPSSLTSIQAAQKRPVSQPKQPGTLILRAALIQLTHQFSLLLFYCKAHFSLFEMNKLNLWF
jgi:hypothetical protein